MISKMNAMLLSMFPHFKFRFDAPLIQISHLGFISSLPQLASSGFFVCMWCAAKKHCVANNVLGSPSCIQGIEMLSLGSLKTGAILLPGLLMHGIFWVVFTSAMLLLPTADAALPSTMFSIGDTLISGICVARALCIAVLRGSKNSFFNCTFLRYTVSLTVIIIMNWFQAAQPALQYVASVVIGFVAVQCLWNREVNQLMNQLMGKVCGGALDDAIAFPEDCGDGLEDGSCTGSDYGNDPHGDGPEDVSSSGSDEDTFTLGPRAVQLLSVRANFPIRIINVFDWRKYLCIYMAEEGEVQEEGMVDLVLMGPSRILEAKGCMGFEVIPADDTSVIEEGWSVIMEDEEVEEYAVTIDGGLGRKLEIRYLLMPDAIETHVEVRLNLKDLGSRSRTVYGSIKASAIDYGSNNVHLFSCDRGRSLSFPCGSTCILPLSPYVIALPFRRRFKLHIEVDLRVITTYDSQREGSQEEGKNLKFCLDFTRRVTRQERDVDGDQVEANVTWYLDRICT